MQTTTQPGNGYPQGYYYPIDTSQQPPLTRDCYFVGELNALSLCTGSGLSERTTHTHTGRGLAPPRCSQYPSALPCPVMCSVHCQVHASGAVVASGAQSLR